MVIVAHRADWLDIESLDEESTTLIEKGGRGTDITPTSIEENYYKPDSELLRTPLWIQRRAGAGSLGDVLLVGPRMMAYRLEKRFRDGIGT